MHSLLFGLFVGYFLTACAPVHWSSALLGGVAIALLVLLSTLITLIGMSGMTTIEPIRPYLSSFVRLAIGACAAALVLGGAMYSSGNQTIDAVGACGDGRLVMRVRILGLPVQHAAGSRFDARVVNTARQYPRCGYLQGRRLRLGIRGSARLWPGQTLVAEVALRPIRGSVSPGAFDHELHSALRGVVLGGYVVQALALREPRLDLLRQIFHFDEHRYALRAAVMQQNLRYGGVVLALATGDSVALEANDWALLRDSGTVHLMVISGLHVGLISALLFVLLRGISGFFSSVWLHALLTSAITYLYVQWVGAGVPATRSWLMVSVLLFGWAANRKVQSATLLLLAAVGVVVLEPLAGLQAGFWLSFALVAWLLAIPRLEFVKPQAGSKRLLRLFASLRKLLGLHLGATLALLPLLVWFGLPLAPAGPVANVFAVPVVTLLLVPWILLWLLVLPWSASSADHLLVVADRLVGWLFFALERVVVLFSAWSLPVVSLAVLIALLLLVLVLLLSTSVSLRVSVTAVLAFWLWQQSPGQTVQSPLPRGAIEPGDYSVQMLDVGQGLAVIIRTADAVVLYDTGASFPSGFNFSDAVVIPALRRMGVNRLDALVVSHSDNDHAGGVKKIIQAMRPRRTAGAIERGAIERGAIERGAIETVFRDKGSVGEHCVWRTDSGSSDIWLSAGVEFVLLSDPGGDSSNNRSCVLWVRTPHAQALFAGDIEASAEQALLNRLPVGVDLLSVAHHGSKTSSTVDFVERVWPGWALVSAGYDNRFGHPHEQVLKRFRAIGATLVTTAEAGTLSWHSADVGGLTSSRKLRRSRWRLGTPLILILEDAVGSEDSGK